MKRTSLGLSLLALLVLAALPAAAEQTTFRFFAGGLNQAIFQSDAPLETITGTSNAVHGQVAVDLASPTSASGSVVIDATSFRTGIDMRDEDLRSGNWIDAATHPEITFELTGVQVPDGATLSSAAPITATLTGNLTFHGQTREVAAEAQVGYFEIDEETRANPMLHLSGNALRVEATLNVTLADFGINVPPILDLKVAHTVSIELRLTGVDSWPEQG